MTASLSLPPPTGALAATPTAALRALATVLFWIVLVMSALFVLAWAFDIEAIKHPWPSVRPMLSAYSLDFLAASTAALMLLSASLPSPLRALARLLALGVGASGLTNAADHLFSLDLNLDFPLFRVSEDATALTYPGPMSPDVALAFAASGIALSLFDTGNNKLTVLAQVLLLCVSINSLIIVSCYAFGKEDLCAFFGCIRFSPITSAAFAILALGVLAARADRGLTAPVCADSPGSKIIRRVLFCLVGLPPIFAVVHAGKTAGLYDDGIAAGVSIGLLVLFLAGCVFWQARKIDIVDAQKRQVESILVQKQTEDSQAPRRRTTLCMTCGHQSADALAVCPADGSTMTAVPADLAPGRVFAQRYEIEGLLGSGGMSTVFKARHQHLRKPVAIKLLHAHLASSTRALKRFEQEGRAISQLNHPNILAVHDLGLSADGDPFLVMDFLQGEDLASVVDRGGPIPPRRALPLFLQICAGLAHAHDRSVLHRDLKPNNIVLVEGQNGMEQAKIVDFGLAKIVSEDGEQSLTQTGDLLGSPLYMSPEQCLGRHVDHRSDIYSMGCLMYECLTGMPPHLGESSFITFSKHVSELPQPFPADLGIPAQLEAVVLKALAKEPEARQQSARELASELERAMRQL